MIHDFLPICRADMDKRGWESCDFVYVCGDAYVDHPSFGHAIISRMLEAHGYKVGIIAQPDWKNQESIQILGEPRLGWLVSAGNMDSMVNHYSVSKKRRAKDSYTPGGEMGKRPDYATIVYSNLIRTWSKKPIILGGIEASLRRLAHYDYWSGKMKRSILLDSQADLISYGMGERSIVEIADALASGIEAKDITFIEGTVYKAENLDSVYDEIRLPSYREVSSDKKTYAESFYTQYSNTDPFSGKRLVEPYSDRLYVVQNPAAKPLTQEEMDDVYALPYMRTWHPCYDAAGGIPAITEVKFSLISNRGCFGGCSFCALTFHQGRIVQTRSHESIIQEAELLTQEPDFKGYIHDVGGPSANFRHTSCQKQKRCGMCKNRSCLAPEPCPNLDADHSEYTELLRRMRATPALRRIPVIMATARGAEYDRVQGLDSGADDYLTKPFSVIELVSRVRAVLRRCQPQEDTGTLRCGELTLDTAEHTVSVAGQRVDLTYKEYELLRLFMTHPGRAFTRDKLMELVWGTDYCGESRTVDMHIRTLRQKLGPYGERIETVRGVGYRMEGRA